MHTIALPSTLSLQYLPHNGLLSVKKYLHHRRDKITHIYKQSYLLAFVSSQCLELKFFLIAETFASDSLDYLMAHSNCQPLKYKQPIDIAAYWEGISERRFPQVRAGFLYLNGVFLSTLFTEAIVLQTSRKLDMVGNQKKRSRKAIVRLLQAICLATW
jgi:hypothetical protein